MASTPLANSSVVDLDFDLPKALSRLMGFLAVPGVTVTVKFAPTGTIRTFTTNAGGLYTAPLLQPGDYEVTFTLSGFQASTVRGIVEEDPRLVAELGARGPIEPRVCRMRIFLREVRSFPVFGQQDRVAAKGPQRGDRRVEVDVEQIPSKDRDVRVVPNAATFLHGNDDGVGWQR